ncbi:MAG: OmpA family protein [Candidatus Marinimicrobia bacterium]|nr:OmpA family protein [Candidatus Neomarinimicrobiota bacterium]MCF7839940.1 OmpA family protein [Candidatus Neomarinimicrobiota bacterium]
MAHSIFSFRSSGGIRDTATWQVTYSSLLTAVLAFFILLIIQAENEVASTYRFADRLKSKMFKEIVREKTARNLDWLYVENTGTKGIRLLVPTQVEDQVLFQTGDDQIESAFFPYLQHLSSIINGLEINRIYTDYSGTIGHLRSLGKDIIVQVRIEGHSDRRPIRTARFSDNWELSTARASRVMEYLELTTNLPADYFALAGYGSFHPFRSVNNLDENRRVEIYLDIQMVEKNGTI